MKKSITLLFLFATMACLAQVSVKKIEPLKMLQGNYYNAQFSPDGSKLLLTTADFTGLKLYDLKTKKVSILNNDAGAGFEPVFTDNGKSVAFRSYEFINRKRYNSLVKQHIDTKKKTVLIEKARELSVPMAANNEIAFSQDNQLTVYNPGTRSLSTEKSDKTAVIIENLNLTLYKNGKKEVLNPNGSHQNYIWASLSPDGSKILYNSPESGTFICDLQGNILVELGRANAPKWSPDGKWITYMDDRDDGYVYLSSDIYAVSADGAKKINLTAKTAEIALFPSWSPDGKQIVFHTDKGDIFLISLHIN